MASRLSKVFFVHKILNRNSVASNTCVKLAGHNLQSEDMEKRKSTNEDVDSNVNEDGDDENLDEEEEELDMAAGDNENLILRTAPERIFKVCSIVFQPVNLVCMETLLLMMGVMESFRYTRKKKNLRVCIPLMMIMMTKKKTMMMSEDHQFTHYK